MSNGSIEYLVLNSKTRNNFTMCQKMSSGLFKDQQNVFTNHIYLIYSSSHKIRNGTTTNTLKICMYVYEIFLKYTWNIYVFITYKVLSNFFSSKLIVN